MEAPLVSSTQYVEEEGVHVPVQGLVVQEQLGQVASMDEWMDGWMFRWMSRWMIRWMMGG